MSTLPGGFQQVHDLAHVYGFQLINHDEGAYEQANATLPGFEGDTSQTMPIDTPIIVSLTSCYHCLASKNRKRTLEHQNSMVVKKYGSMVNTLDNSSFGGTPGPVVDI